MEQKWWSLFGKYWFIKNGKNDDGVKLMKWLMTGSNHGTIDTCGENVSLHCDETYYTKHYDDGVSGKNDKIGTGLSSPNKKSI